jgi:hypothetical protein
MNGIFYGVYDLKNDEACVGVFESTAEVCAFFGGITESRVWCGRTRDNALTFKTERYRVDAFKVPTKKEVREVLSRRFGKHMFKISPDGVFIREEDTLEWTFFAEDFEDAIEMCG